MYHLKGQQQQNQRSLNVASETDDSGMGCSVDAHDDARARRSTSGRSNLALTDRSGGSSGVNGTLLHRPHETSKPAGCTTNQTVGPSRKSRTDIISQMRAHGAHNAYLPALKKNTGTAIRPVTKPSGDQMQKRYVIF